jgi:hypothetical protein
MRLLRKLRRRLKQTPLRQHRFNVFFRHGSNSS